MAIAIDPQTARIELLRLEDRYRPVVMWYWNARETGDEIRRQIREFKAQGILEFFIHGLYGKETGYLDEAFMYHVGVAIDEARRQGMRFWIYDENSWPSGLAGGKVIRDHPEARMRQLLLGRFELAAGEEATLATPGDWLVGFALYHTGGERPRVERIDAELTTWRNATAHPVTLYAFRTIVSGGVHPACKWTAFTWEQEGSLDVADPEAVRHFLDSTHELYYKHFADDFGKTLAGSFTDEPVLSTGWILEFPAPFIGMPWTRRMLETFKAERGYDLLDVLYQIATDYGDETKTRYDYWCHISDSFANAYGRQIGEWCAEHNIELTGHINCEESLLGTIYASGDLFRVLKHFQQPGIDSVESGLWMHLEETVVPPKIISSLVHQTGRERSFCETYTGSGWDMNFELMRRVFDRLSVLGVNVIQFMGAHYSIKGFRKLTPDANWPPSHSYQNALWPHYGAFTDYMARVTRLNELGTHVARIAVLYPIASAWTIHRAGHGLLVEQDPNYELNWRILAASFDGLTRGLLEVQADFDYVFDEPLRDATVEGDTLRIRDEAYHTIILPAATLFEFGGFEKLQEFVAAGGRLLIVNALPSHRQDGSSLAGELAAWGIDHAALTAHARAILSKEEPATELVASALPNVNVLLSNSFPPALRAHVRPELLRALGREAFNVSIDPPSPHIYVQTRKDGDALRVCLINEGPEPYTGTLELHAAPQPHLVLVRPDLQTCEPLAAQSASGALAARIELGGYASFFVQTAAEPLAALPAFSAAPSHVMELDGTWEAAPLTANLLRLPLSVLPAAEDQAAPAGGEGFHPIPDFRYGEGLEVINGVGSGYGQMAGSFPLTSLKLGGRYWVHAAFELDPGAPQALTLVLEDEGLVPDSLRVNGQALALQTQVVWDEANVLASLSGVARPGRNEVLFQVQIPEWRGPHALPMVAVMGAFGLSEALHLGPAPAQLAPGDWAQQGYPHFSGTMVFSRTVELPAVAAGLTRGRLTLADSADVVELWVDGQPCAKHLWGPYRFEFDLPRAGSALRLELRVTNTSAPVYGKPKASGFNGPVRLELGTSAEV